MQRTKPIRILLLLTFLPLAFGMLALNASAAPQDAPTNPSTANLVAWWKLDEQSGTRNDSHTNALHLSDNNTVSYATGKIGNAADFELSNTEYLSAASTSALQMGTADITISAWVNPETVGSVQQAIVSKMGSTAFEYYLYLGADGKFTFLIGNGNNSTFTYVYSTATITAGNWYYVAAWTSKVDRSVYIQVDNATIYTQTWSVGTNYNGSTVSTFMIGNAGHSAVPDDGLIDEVGMYKRALTADEREWLYNSGAGRTYDDINPATATNTYTPTNTGTNTHTSTPTNTPTSTGTATDTPTNTATFTPTNTGTQTPTDTPTETLTPTNTGTATLTPTITDTPTITPTGGTPTTWYIDRSVSLGDYGVVTADLALICIIAIAGMIGVALYLAQHSRKQK